MRSRDTSPEAHRIQMELFRQMGSSGRLARTVELSDQVWEMAAEGVRSRHPEYDEDEVRWALFRMRVGDELFRLAWPDAPLLPS